MAETKVAYCRFCRRESWFVKHGRAYYCVVCGRRKAPARKRLKGNLYIVMDGKERKLSKEKLKRTFYATLAFTNGRCPYCGEQVWEHDAKKNIVKADYEKALAHAEYHLDRIAQSLAILHPKILKQCIEE